ncbi:hypothetical protein TrST_g4716 [Triparma strigata]|uniref:START domain-containing protein n=1 Tax=Triparma strigata TaxID=1606541 RepID=A0A9W7ECB2_9STRA|nr:hypothetical protein TrST_g4716 [Triparma strigata]
MAETSPTLDQKVPDLAEQIQAQASAAEKWARTLEQAALPKMENDEQGQAFGELGLTIVASSSWRSESSDVFHIAKDNVHHPDESLHVLNEGLENIILSPELSTTIPAREIYEVGRTKPLSRRRAGKAIGPGTQQRLKPISKDDMAWEGGGPQTKEAVASKNHKGGKCKRTKPHGMCLVVPPKACLISEKQRTHSDGKVVDEARTVSEMHSKSEVVDEARLISERQLMLSKDKAGEADDKAINKVSLLSKTQSMLSKDKADEADSKVVDETGPISGTQSVPGKGEAGEVDSKVVDEARLILETQSMRPGKADSKVFNKTGPITGTQSVPGKGEADEADSKVVDEARLILETQSLLPKDKAGKADSKVVDETGPILGTQSVLGKGEADESDSKVVDEARLISETQSMRSKDKASKADSKVVEEARLILETHSMFAKDKAGETISEKTIDADGSKHSNARLQDFSNTAEPKIAVQKKERRILFKQQLRTCRLVFVALILLSLLGHVNADAPASSHGWDFRNCATGQDVLDTGEDGGKTASPINGPTCTASGISLDGNNDYVNIANSWEWGGTTSFEVYVKYDSFNDYSRVFDFSNGAGSDNVLLYNYGTTSTIRWGVYQGSTWKLLLTSNFDSSTWTHVVFTVSGTTMKIYKNGALAGTKTDGYEPNVLTRTNHIIGNRAENDSPFDGTIAYVKMWHGVELQQSDVTDLYAPHNTAHHFWDFRGCTTGGTVTDNIAGDLVATPVNGPVCGADGLRLDGNNDYADIDDWEWGGTTSIEVYVKYDSFNDYSRVFDFSNGAGSDNVLLYNYGTTSTIRWEVKQGSTGKWFSTSNWDSSTWTHAVVTVSGTTMKIYKNGALAGTMTDGHEPNVLTRTQNWLGRSAWASDGYFDGTIAYVKVWHGVELTDSDASTLYSNRDALASYSFSCPAGSSNPTEGETSESCVPCSAGESSSSGSINCTPCAAGSYSGASSPACIPCAAGKYLQSATTSNEADACSNCPSGSYSGASSASCTSCAVGKHLVLSTASSEPEACSSCPLGTYSDSAGSSTCTPCPDGETNFATGAAASSSCVPATHVWNFLGCSDGTPVVDGTEGSSLKATAKNGAKCTAEGIEYDGVDAYVDIDDWEWGGTTSIEVYVKYDSFNDYSRVFDFSNGEYSDNVNLANQGTTSTIYWDVRQGSTQKQIQTSNFDSSTWTHAVVTVSGTTMKVYKNGALVGTNTDGHEPNVLTRTQHWLGRSAWSHNGYFDGTIAYLKIYHNKELTDSDVAALRHSLPCVPGTFGVGFPDCSTCPAGSYSVAGSTTSCTTCPAGSYLEDAATDLYFHDNLLDCKVCSAGKYLSDGATNPALHSSSSQCLICQAGKFAADKGMEAAAHEVCTACPVGKNNEDDAADRFLHNGEDDCLLCTPGRYSSNPAGAATCDECPEGKLSGSGAAACGNCPPGYECSGGGAAPCPDGEYSNGLTDGCVSCDKGYSCPGATDRIACPSGSHQPDASQATCVPCAAGKYQELEGQDACKDCPSGYFCLERSTNPITCSSYADEAGLSACKSAPPGNEPDAAREGLKSCDAGEASIGGGEICSACADGFFTSSPGSPTCFACEAGKYANAEQTECLLCPAGKISGVAQSSCAECEAGKLSEGEGNSECLACPSYQTSNPGSFACHCKDSFVNTTTINPNEPCTCGPGYTLEGGNCVPCALGFFKSSTSLDLCESCNKVALKGATGSFQPASSKETCTCGKGDFKSLKPPPLEGNETSTTFIGQCLECPEGTSCVEPGVTVKELPVKRGYWRSDDNSSNIVKCYIEEACAQSPAVKSANVTKMTSDHQCAMGHIGPVCNVCLPGFAKDVLGHCLPCESDKGFHVPVESWIFLFVLVVVLPVTLFFMCKKPTAPNNRLSNFRQRSVSRERSRSSPNGLVAAQTNRDHWFYRARTKAKILVSFYQIVTSFESVLEIRFPPVYEKFMRWVSSTANLDALQLVRADCIVDTNFYTSLLAQTLLPIAISSLIFAVFVIMKFTRGRNSRDRRARYRDFASSSFLTLTYLVFASVSKTIFDTFNCQQFGDDPTFYLARDQEIDCNSDTHKLYQLYATAMIFVYPIGVPVCYLFVLARNRQQIRSPERDYDPLIQKTSFLWANYEPELWWWEVFECGRHAVFGEKHLHEGALRGMNEDLTRSKRGFVEHFVRIAGSTVEEAGWVLYTKPKEKWKSFVTYSGAVVERRCSSGRGPIDEIRGTFVVHARLDRVKRWVVNADRDLRMNDAESYMLGGQNSEAGRRVFYLCKKLQGSFSKRDYLLEGFEGTLDDGRHYVVHRSLEDDRLYSLKKSHQQGRVRGKVKYCGWLFYSVEGGRATKVTYVENIDPGGMFKGAIIKKCVPLLLRDRVDDLLAEMDQEHEHQMFSEFGGGDVENFGIEAVEMTSLRETGALKRQGAGGHPSTFAASNPLHEGKKGMLTLVKKEEEEVVEKNIHALLGGGLGGLGGEGKVITSKVAAVNEEDKKPSARESSQAKTGPPQTTQEERQEGEGRGESTGSPHSMSFSSDR